MQDRDAKLLFEYLGSILYESDPVPPAEDEISPGARELLGGLSCLSTYVKELTAYSHALVGVAEEACAGEFHCRP